MLISRTVSFVVEGQSRGDLAYFNGTEWVRLPIGTVGQAVGTDGDVPLWVTLPSGGSSDKVRTSGTLTTTGSVSLTLPGIASFLGARVIELNLALSDGVSHQSAYIRITLDSALSIADIVNSLDGTGTFYDPMNTPSFADSAGDLVITIPLTVGAYSLIYRVSGQEA